MKYIGIRVSPSEIYYAIAEDNGSKGAISVSLDSIVVPRALPLPRRLSYIRTVLQSIITEQSVKIAGLRLAEVVANPHLERIYIEGVIQEFFENSTIEQYEVHRIQTLAYRFKQKPQILKGWINNNDQSPDWYDGWINLNKQKRESLLVAKALLMKGEEI